MSDTEGEPELPSSDEVLHAAPSSDPTPEDVVLASGRDMTPENLEWARKRLAEEGRAALDKELP
ncbi:MULTISPECIES: hypothetical protein [Streptomyces]|uniref:hypothetical protein n=1 Tax=Streptomyces TaxID=1883 RepID=UPI0002D93376|nr:MULTISPECIES: hypothetical protein [Streptomyces]